jgi:taurine dioxygenase
VAAVLAPAFALVPLERDFGAEVRGLDIARPLDEGTAQALRAAFGRHRLLVFRDQFLPPAEQIAFSRIFGELEIHVLNEYHKAGHPEIFELSNLDADGKPNAVHPDQGTLFWHTDASWQAAPAMATLLYAEAVPRHGGHTLFADMIGACEALGAAERAQFATLSIVHDLEVSRRKAGYPGMTAAQRAQRPPVVQPLVRRHQPTGRDALYLGSHGQAVVGMDEIAGRGLIERVMAHATEPRFVVEHAWRPGDLVMWDNGATMHRATEYDTALEPRVVRRTVIQGAPAVRG